MLHCFKTLVLLMLVIYSEDMLPVTYNIIWSKMQFHCRHFKSANFATVGAQSRNQIAIIKVKELFLKHKKVSAI